MAVWAKYKVLVDWDNDGNYANAYSDITPYIEGDWSWEYGRDKDSQLVGRFQSVSFNAILNNSSLLFSRFGDSPIASKLLPGRRFKVTMQIGSGTVVTKCVGRLQNITPQAAAMRSQNKVALAGIGVLGWLQKTFNVNVGMQTAILSGAAMGVVLDAINWPAGERLLDVGMSTFQRYWSTADMSTSAFDVLRDIADSEAGFLRETQLGYIGLEDRSHRFTAPHTVSQATYTNNPAGSIRYEQIIPVDTIDEVFNIVTAQLHMFNLQENQTLWQLVNIRDKSQNAGVPVKVAAGTTLKLTAQYPNANSGGVGVDDWGIVTLEANTQSDGTGTDHSNDLVLSRTDLATQMNISIGNPLGVDVWIIVLYIVGTAVVEGNGSLLTSDVDNTASLANYGSCVYPFPGKFLTSQSEGQLFCNYFADLYKDLRNACQLVLDANATAAHLLEAQTRDVSDRITIVSDEGMNNDFFVEHVKHEISQNGLHKMTLLCSQVAGTAWPASDISYTPVTLPEGDAAADNLWTRNILRSGRILFAAGADKWNAKIDLADFRAKLVPVGDPTPETVDLRTVAEGGTLVHNGTTQFAVSDIAASYAGVNYQIFFGANLGRWYFAFRFHNNCGWSVWTDGNNNPQYVKDFCDTQQTLGVDTGPASGWSVQIVAGPQSGTYQIVVTRPTTNANKIFGIFYQARLSAAGAWREVDANAGAAFTRYDGSATAHTYDPIAGTITKTSGVDYGVQAGDELMLMMDVRQSNFNVAYCVWVGIGSLSQFSGNVISGLSNLTPAFAPDGTGKYTDIRIKLVRPPWAWDNTHPSANTDGYQGLAGYDTAVYYMLPQGGDTTSVTFMSAPLTIPAGHTLTDLQARVWFWTTYSITDNGATHSPNPSTTTTGDAGVIQMSASGAFTIDCNLGNVFHVTLTGNSTLNALTNAKHDRPIIVIIEQDGTGGHSLGLNASFKYGKELTSTACVISTSAGKRNYFGFIYNAVATQTDIVAFVSGYPT